MKKSKTIDYLNDTPIRILLAVAGPLLVVNCLSILTTAITNQLYTEFAGTEYFAISGYISTVLNNFLNITSSITSAAWILSGMCIAKNNAKEIQLQLATAIFTIGVVAASISIVLIVGADPILTFFSVPDELYADAKLLYIGACATMTIGTINSFLLTVFNGTSSAKHLFMMNLYSIFSNVVFLWVFLAVFHAGILGIVLASAIGGLVNFFVYFVLLKRRHLITLSSLLSTLSHPRWGDFRRIVQYGLFVAFQNFLCALGYFAVSAQTNRYLSTEYITVLNVSLPITGALGALSSAITAFCPQNYGRGDASRLKHFLKLSTIIGIAYSLLCFAVYALFGQWYYGRLFDDPAIIANGAQYWLVYGTGFVFLSLIYTVRFFLDAVRQTKLALLSGVGELLGNIICAFCLIPRFGNVGRSLAYPLGWFLGSAFLVIAYYIARKRIYTS